ncbi:MAG: succinylglutamate desuccinylase/aspartoacylase family protein [Mycobacterium leprae]
MSKRVQIEPFHPHELEFFTFGNPEAGPRVLVTAGLHGGEASGIYAARKLVRWLQGETVKGAVTVLPVANPAAFRRLRRTSPYDDLDLNRIFPGKKEGSPSQVTAAAIWEEAQKADYIVDLHCCGIFGSDYTLALWQDHEHSRALAAMLDIPVVVNSGGTRNQMFVEASHAGIPAVIIELAGGQLGDGGGLINRESAENAFRAVSNLLKRLGMVPGETPEAKPTFYDRIHEVPATRAGLWQPAIAAGAAVTKGQRLGDLEGMEVTAPQSGIAISVRWESFVFPGHGLVNIAQKY